jgi:hypothetical protein
MTTQRAARNAAIPLLAALLAAGCGGGGHHPATAANATASAPRAAGYLTAGELRRDLGNGFRAGLDKLAVMDQPVDDATELGQALPTGLLHGVSCSPAAPRPAGAQPWQWSCSVKWKTAGGRARTTRYAVRLFPTRCFAAGADPALPAHRDPTIGSFAEHPLNTVVSVKRGC